MSDYSISNFFYIMDRCNLIDSQVYNTSSPKFCIAKSTFKKIKDDQKISKTQIKKFLTMIKEFYVPSIEPLDIYEFINYDLMELNVTFEERKNVKELNWYIGSYFSYYLSSKKRLEFAIIRIIPDRSQFLCEGIFHIDDSLFRKSIYGNVICNDILENSLSMKELYNIISTNAAEEEKKFCLYNGVCTLLSDSILLNFISNNNSHSRIISFNRYDQYYNDESRKRERPNCYGAIGNMLKTPYTKKPSVFQKIVLSRFGLDIDDNENINIIVDGLDFDEICDKCIVQDYDKKNDELLYLIRKHKGQA